MNTTDLYDELADAATRPPSGETAALLASAPAVVLYGAGGAGRDVQQFLAARGVAVRCFLDRGARPGDHRDGVPVLVPSDPSLSEARRTLPVVITVFNHHADGEEIRRGLQAQGWTWVVPFVHFHRAFAAGLGDRYWLVDPAFYRDQAGPMRDGATLWADERSRAIYDAVLRYRLSGEPEAALAPDLTTSYFPEDLPPWTAPGRFVDCGAFDGDTLDEIRARRWPLEAVAAFEPDPAQFSKLTGALRALAAEDGVETMFWPCAVHSHTTQLRFATGLGMASNLHPDGDQVVQAVALDDVVSGFRPTLVKLDIEGAEPDALLGAQETIRRHRPGLAVCVYHRPQHLWQIGQLLRSWDLGYRFWLREHGYNGYDLVLYAQPGP